MYRELDEARTAVEENKFDKAIALALISIAETLDSTNFSPTVNVTNGEVKEVSSWG